MARTLTGLSRDDELDELIGCVGRQLEWLRWRLPVEVAERRMTQAWASGELARMSAVLTLLERLRRAQPTGEVRLELLRRPGP